jgi:hypothetical protein
MKAFTASRTLFLLTIASTFAGCLSATPAPSPQAAAAPDLAPILGADGQYYAPNAYLLDQPPMPGGRVSGGAEPTILADRDGQFLWVGDTSGIHRSANNGATWVTLPDPVPLVADGFTLAQDDVGTLYAATTTIPYVHFLRSINDGTSWATQNVAEASPIADRPWLAARGNGEVALFIYAYGRTFTEACARSTDGGLTWADRDLMAGNPQGGNAAFDTNGDLLYSDDTGRVSRFKTSTLGKCAGAQQVFQLVNGKGAQHMEALAVENGEVYVAAPAVGNGQMVLWGTRDFLTRKSVVVSAPAQLSNTFGTVSVRNGEIAVAWYGSDTAGDPSNANFAGSWNVYVSRVTNFWTATPTVTTVRLTTEANHVGDLCMAGTGCGGASDRDLLDYFGVDHGPNGVIHVAYGHDGAGGVAEVRYAQVV